MGGARKRKNIGLRRRQRKLGIAVLRKGRLGWREEARVEGGKDGV